MKWAAHAIYHIFPYSTFFNKDYPTNLLGSSAAIVFSLIVIHSCSNMMGFLNAPPEYSNTFAQVSPKFMNLVSVFRGISIAVNE